LKKKRKKERKKEKEEEKQTERHLNMGTTITCTMGTQVLLPTGFTGKFTMETKRKPPISDSVSTDYKNRGKKKTSMSGEMYITLGEYSESLDAERTQYRK
jgi:hypothetical protein